MLKTIFGKNDRTPLDGLIDTVLDEMNAKGTADADYPELLTKLERLYELKTHERRTRISPDTLVSVGGSLLGILVIVAYEQHNVITSKAMALVRAR